ncbi:ion transport peptide-like isoform X1 [Cotesia glomerata]|uniref:ion transport peptide-like isoform X1 n=2 Tax=Cotesia glomerata TaxID=32391 RepID=UPI001D001A40|nr:ion transport peptide-like isoform X1 [Cotesia glomerata]
MTLSLCTALISGHRSTGNGSSKIMQVHHQRQPSSLSTTNLSVKLATSIPSARNQHTCQPVNLLSTSITTMSGRIVNFSSPLYINRNFVSSSVLLSIIAWSVTILLISSCLDVADAGLVMGHSLGKRSYFDLGCKGVYDKSIFARLDRVCEDCFNLFREPQLHTLCRKDCFTTYYFKGCVETLLMQDEIEQFKNAIKQLHGADPGV